MLNKNIRLLGVIAMLWECIMTGQAKNYDDKADTCRFVTNSFWDNWFIQAGVGMSLQNVYGKDFTNVFPKGNTFGINFGFGKLFSPEIGCVLVQTGKTALSGKKCLRSVCDG